MDKYAHYYKAIKNIGHHARLKENEHLFRYRAWLERNFFRCVRARANLKFASLIFHKIK